MSIKSIYLGFALIFSFVFGVFSPSVLAEKNEVVSGKVVSVYDGDTMTVFVDGAKALKVRMAEIDAPEKAQKFGDKSQQYLHGLVFGKTVELQILEEDRYKRSVSLVFVEGVNINKEMVKNGYAYVYHEYSKDKSFAESENIAKENKLGLWSLPESERVLPSQWRKDRKVTSVTKSEGRLPVYHSGGEKSGFDTSCSSKTMCKQMTSCAEAKFYLNSCAMRNLDKNGDGVPCESLCK